MRFWIRITCIIISILVFIVAIGWISNERIKEKQSIANVMEEHNFEEEFFKNAKIHFKNNLPSNFKIKINPLVKEEETNNKLKTDVGTEISCSYPFTNKVYDGYEINSLRLFVEIENCGTTEMSKVIKYNVDVYNLDNKKLSIETAFPLDSTGFLVAGPEDILQPGKKMEKDIYFNVKNLKKDDKAGDIYITIFPYNQ